MCLCLDKVTTTLTVFQIWYCGVDLCLSRCSESSALLKIFCFIHAWGRALCRARSLSISSIQFFVTASIGILISFTRTHGNFCLWVLCFAKFLPSCTVQANITVSASEINLLSTLIVLGTVDMYILPCHLTGTGMSTLWVELATNCTGNYFLAKIWYSPSRDCQILVHVKETNPDNLYWEIGNFWKFMPGGSQEKKWPGL